MEVGYDFDRWGIIDFDPKTMAARLRPDPGMARKLRSFWSSVSASPADRLGVEVDDDDD
jgi:hypothetical protein